MPVLDSVVEKYLSTYAEPESRLAMAGGASQKRHYSRCLVIPAYREDLSDIEAACERITGSFLLILVVNAPHPDRQTRALMMAAKGTGKLIASNGNVCHIARNEGYDVLLVDRCTEQNLIGRGGVGTARKIGADVALALMANGMIDAGMIYTTDADTTLPVDYFDAVSPDDQTAAVLYPFRHRASDEARTASLLYEISMLYYVAGLKRARSAYAHLTIGSTLSVNPVHYARVRGFPKRPAAEDFYLLNKLAKTGRIIQLQAPLIEIDARPSDRTPFGTGAALANIMAMRDPVSEYLFYDPRVFEYLGRLIEWLDDAATLRGNPPTLDPVIASFVADSGLGEQIGRWTNSLAPQIVKKRIADWMDGFRTLKMIHYLRQHQFPSLPLADVMGSDLLPTTGNDAAASLTEIREDLARICFERNDAA